jgi:hypothetical protein
MREAPPYPLQYVQKCRLFAHDLTREIAAFERFMERAESGLAKREPRSTALLDKKAAT